MVYPDDRVFNYRVWKPTLGRAGVLYRKPYNCRHTFVSNALLAGVPPMHIAAITGHSVDVLYKHYAEFISTNPSVPELWT